MERDVTDIEVLDGTKKHIRDESVRIVGFGEVDKGRMSELKSGQKGTVGYDRSMGSGREVRTRHSH